MPLMGSNFQLGLPVKWKYRSAKMSQFFKDFFRVAENFAFFHIPKVEKDFSKRKIHDNFHKLSHFLVETLVPIVFSIN